MNYGKRKKFFVLGVEVDEATHKDYMGRKFPFKGSDISLSTLHLYATDGGIARDLPDVHREAKQMVEQIKAEITGYSRPAGFKVFLEELNAAHKEAVAEFNRIHGALAIADKELERARNDKDAPAYMLDIAKGDHARAMMEFEQSKNRPAEIMQEKAKEIRGRMAAYVGKVYRANPDAVDASTMRLLESGIVTAAELEGLSERFRDNPTMLRLMAAHAKKEVAKSRESGGDRGADAKWTALAALLGTASDSNRAMEGFDALVEQSVRSMSRRSFSDYPADAMRGKVFDDSYSRVLAAYDNFLIQPTEAVE